MSSFLNECSNLLIVLYSLIQLLGIFFAVHALMNSRTPQGSIAWIFALIFLPFISIPFYLALGRSRFPEYVEARRSGHKRKQKKVIGITNNVIGAIEPYTIHSINERSGLRSCLSDLVNLPFTQGNDLKLLIDGHQTFNTLFHQINAAKKYILLEFYIIKNDRVGEEFQNLLVKKAREGVEIYLLFDELGSRKLPLSYLHAFRSEPNIKITPFSGKRKWFSNIIRLNFRNHRKIVIIDGKQGFIGGLNIGNEYLGKSKIGFWRDTFCQISGPAVPCIQLAFQEDWHWATGEVLDFPLYLEPAKADKSILIMPSGPADLMETWRLSTIALINSAKKRLWIASPYFVPGSSVMSALQVAALRGVDVKILLPHKADHLLVYGSSFTFYPEAIPYGIQIYRYNKGFLHEKVMLIDDDLSVIGTANLDNRSMRLNFEINALIHNKETAREVETMFHEDFSYSSKVRWKDFRKHGWFFRLGCRIARLLSPIQ